MEFFGFRLNWKQHKKDLLAGKDVSFCPKGNSMKPKINSGDEVTVSPTDDIKKGDIVFCKVKGNFYVHLVKTMQGKRYQIGNNKGKINGWINKSNIFGKVTKVRSQNV